MKKRLLNTIFATTAVLALASCGGADVVESSTKEENTSAESVESEEASAESVESSTTKSERGETPTIYLAGDSTVKTYNDDQYIGGWGQYLSYFLDDSVKVANAAQGGRSARSFINEGRLYDTKETGYSYTFSENGGKSIESCIKEGDFLFIQFGHNDDSSKGYTTMFDRMIPVGEADENGIYPVTAAEKTTTTELPEEYVKALESNISNAEERTTALNKAKAEIAKYGANYYSYSSGTYKWYLKQYIDFAREKGATPVLITPVARVKFGTDGKIIGGPGLHGYDAKTGKTFTYVEAVRQLAEEEDCLLIDLFADTKLMLETATANYANYLMALKPNSLTGTWPLGYDNAYNNSDAGYTGIEATHYNKYGAYVTAAYLAKEILSETKKVNNGKEFFNFTDHIKTTPSSYIGHPNLMSRSKSQAVDALVEGFSLADPNRVYMAAKTVRNRISNEIPLTINESNYLEVKATIESIMAEYMQVNVDDREKVTNYNELTSALTKVREIEKSKA